MRRIEVVKVECLSTYLCWILRLLFGQSALVDCCCSADSEAERPSAIVGTSKSAGVIKRRLVGLLLPRVY